MPTPSLVNIPFITAPNVLFSQIPESGAGDFTVTRTTSPVVGQSTRVNAAGLIELVADNVARLDYPLGGAVNGCPALLVEPSAQNLVQRSEEFNNAFWNPIGLNTFGSGSVANTTATRDPYGTNLADYIQENSTPSSAHLILAIFSGNVSGTTYTWSVFAKAAERTIINLLNNAAGGGNANFNLTTGVVTLNTGVSASMENYGNGWWRCRLTYTSAITGNHNIQIRLCDASGNATYNGTGNQGAYIFGAQLETGSVPTSYIPTTTAAVTRSAEIISDTTASALIGQTEGTIYAEFEHTSNTAERRLIALSDGTAANRIMVWALNNILYAQIQGNNIVIANPITSGYNKVAFAYQQNGVSGNLFAIINGGAVVSGTSTTYPSTLSRVVLGSRENAAVPDLQWNNRIRAAALYPNRISNLRLEFLTAPVTYTTYAQMANALSYILP